MKRNYILLGIFSLFICIGVFMVYIPYTSTAHPLLEIMEQHFTKEQKIDKKAIQEMRGQISEYTDSYGRVTPELQKVLYAIEDRFSRYFLSDALEGFQSVVAEVGGKMRKITQMPTKCTPFWLVKRDEFVNYRSTPNLPEKADIVIVGAGLTGSSAAYHVNKMAPDKKVVVVEMDRPAAQASGKNGGNFQLLAESYTKDTYEGMVKERVKILSAQNSRLHPKEVRKLAEIQAKILLRFSYHNSECFQKIIKEEKIDCDFSSKGWLRIASSKKEETALIHDVKWLKTAGMGLEKQIQLLSPKEIKEKFHLCTPYYGRFIHGSGNYHPYKFVKGLLKRAIQRGVDFYAGVKVESIEQLPQDKKVVLKTSGGTIECDKVIVATNAFTPSLFQDLKAIKCVPSLIMNLEHVPNNLKEITVTARGGDFYYNFPRCTCYVDDSGVTRGMLHIGLDDYVNSTSDPAKMPLCEQVFREMKSYTDRVFPSTRYQPPSRVWAGPMAFTEDRIPIIGFMYFSKEPQREINEVIIAAAFQGYGGSYCIQAGKVAAEMALSGKTHSDVPEEMFSPKRFVQ